MSPSERQRSAISLLIFAAVFITLTVSSYTRESATWDEPQHVVTGYSALRFHDYRTDPEHPPFLRMWAALPLLMLDDVKIDLQRIDAVDPVTWAGRDQFFFCHETLYVANDADHLLYQARFMIVLLGVLLGVLLFCWTRELLGFWPAAIVLGLYTIEPNLLAHARLVTTDFGVTCFIFGTLYFLWRTTRRLTVTNLCGLLGFFVSAQVSKFSALLLGPDRPRPAPGTRWPESALANNYWSTSESAPGCLWEVGSRTGAWFLHSPSWDMGGDLGCLRLSLSTFGHACLALEFP